jgi:hypothetical protein
VTGPSAGRFALLLALAAAACVEPAQLGGLGVFNPNGVSGRMQLASRVDAAGAEKAQRNEPPPGTRASPAGTAEPRAPSKSTGPASCAP